MPSTRARSGSGGRETPTGLPPRPETLGDLLDRLGGVPAARVLLDPFPGTATEKDVLRQLAAPRKRICELIEGTLVEKAVGYGESEIAAILVMFLNQWVLPRNLGVVTGADGMMRLWRGRVRGPDVAFVSFDRMPGGKRPRSPIPDLVPELAIEVLSRSNSRREIELKLDDYFRAGCRLVWIIDPRKRVARAHTAAKDFVELGETGTLDGGDVLPGLQIPVRAIFPARIE